MLARNLLSAALVIGVAATSIAADNPSNTKPIRIVLVGDSTVASYAKPPADKPDLTGWGQVFGGYFDDRVTVLNHAKSGRSTRSFIKEGLWKRALADKGDCIFIQFGHNDSHVKDGKPAVDPATDFQSYLRQYIDEARAAGAKPLLVTPVARRTFKDGKIVTGLQPYADAMLKVGKEKGVPVIDLHAAAMRLFDRLGDAGSADMTASASDRTHFSRKGALAMAQIVEEALPAEVPELRPYLKPAASASRPSLDPKLVASIGAAAKEFDQISAEHREALEKIAAYVQSRIEAGHEARLIFICTHNSRRSHLSAVWAQAAACYYGIPSVKAYSGGTETTACNPRTLAALERAGFKIKKTSEGKNPVYEVNYAAEREPLKVFSKVYSDPPNPTSDFCAVMNCDKADKSCPLVRGCALRIPLLYDDPKAFDDTPREARAYDERSRQICREAAYLFSKVSLAKATRR